VRIMLPLAARPGLIVVDELLNLLAFNSEAIQILAFPKQPKDIGRLNQWISRQIRERLFDGRAASVENVMPEFQSFLRTYVCRSLTLNTNGAAVRSQRASIAILLERKGNDVIKLQEVVQRYRLTARELETVQLLLQGLTSKEIAQRMTISPNTVRAFIRLVMLKMNVSTRSGIIGKLVGPKN
jgi:DNA-binding CsgD family transcriptional regulator